MSRDRAPEALLEVGGAVVLDGKAADAWPLGAAMYTLTMWQNWTDSAAILVAPAGTNTIANKMAAPHRPASDLLKDLLIGQVFSFAHADI
jgi:hypothetical protein